MGSDPTLDSFFCFLICLDFGLDLRCRIQGYHHIGHGLFSWLEDEGRTGPMCNLTLYPGPSVHGQIQKKAIEYGSVHENKGTQIIRQVGIFILSVKGAAGRPHLCGTLWDSENNWCRDCKNISHGTTNGGRWSKAHQNACRPRASWIYSPEKAHKVGWFCYVGMGTTINISYYRTKSMTSQVPISHTSASIYEPL